MKFEEAMFDVPCCSSGNRSSAVGFDVLLQRSDS